MNKNEKVSVVMATFNGINYIEEQLDSIRFQTLEPEEVIICDDASTDGTYDFLCFYVNLHRLDNWKVLKNNENHGWIENFYNLFELTNCDIIFCADQDDIWLTNKIELMTKIISSDPKIKVLGGNNVKVDVHGNKKKSIFKILKNINKGKLKKIMWNGKFYLTQRPGCAICFRKDLLMHVNRIKTKYYPHDQLIWNIASTLDGAYTVNEDVIFQRRHNESAMIKKRKQKKRVSEIENTLKIVKILEKYISDSILTNAEKLIIVKKAEKFFELRISFMNHWSLKSSFLLLEYLSFYPKYRSYFADLKESVRNTIVSD